MEQLFVFLFKYRPTLFSRSDFGFGVRPSLVAILLAVAAVGLLLYFLYSKPAARLGPASRIALIITRCALLLLMGFLLMRPVIVAPYVVPQSSYVAVLVDDSASMKLPHDGAGARLDAVRRLLEPGNSFSDDLNEKFKVRLYGFSDGLRRLDAPDALSGEGERTELAAALEQALRDSAGLPLTGIVLLSDGAGNQDGDERTLASTLNNLRARNVPVFTVGFGETEMEGDIELVRASASRRVLVGSPVTVELMLRAGPGRSSVRIDLEENGHKLRSQDFPVQSGTTSVARFTFTPSSAGIHRYRFTAVAAEDEPVADNNAQELVLEVEDARPRVLHMEGEPRWEYGKLRTAMSEEKNVVLVSVLRSAEGKFYRQGVESGDELVSGFPQGEEDLFKFDALILGTIEATFFSFDQLRAIEQFVSRRGGTLLALGGPRSFNAGGYGETPVADLLPVALRGDRDEKGREQAYRVIPSERGRDHPAARLLDQQDQNNRAWEQMPAVSLPEVITEIKPGATVILEATDGDARSRSVPVLVEERYGRGRSLALLASDTWRWRMMLDSKNKSYETFWKNLLRHCVESVRRPVEVSATRSFYAPDERVSLRVEVADDKYVSVTDALVYARVVSPSGSVTELQMSRSAVEGFDGYVGETSAGEEGIHRVEVSARRGRQGKEGATLGEAKTSFIVGPLNREAFGAAQNRELLNRIALDTGGRYYEPGRAPNIVDDLVHTEGENSIRMTYDLWDMPVNFLLLIGLAAAEWFLRKRKGLA